jgi:hypothetical protein
MMDNKQMSPHFNLFEMTCTNHRRYLEENIASVTPELYKVGIILCETFLEPLRAVFNQLFIIHSGFRCLELNKAIGGSDNSQHTKFEAVDFHITGISLGKIFDHIRSSKLPYGQLILEGIRAGRPSWIHLSLGEPYRPLEKCRQAMTWDGEKYSIAKQIVEHREPSLGRLGLVTASKLNIRSGPGAIAPTVTQPLGKGTKVEIVQELDDWYKVNLQIQGWVKKEYIKT